MGKRRIKVANVSELIPSGDFRLLRCLLGLISRYRPPVSCSLMRLAASGLALRIFASVRGIRWRRGHRLVLG
jgi:hypothetical protein